MTAIYWVLFWFNFPILLFWALFGIALSKIGLVIGNENFFLYGRRIALSADQMANTFAAGFQDETLSSRLGRAKISGRPTPFAQFLIALVNGIFFWEKDHVVEAIEEDKDFVTDKELWPWHEKDVA